MALFTGNFEGYRSSVPGVGMKTKYMFLLYESQCHQGTELFENLLKANPGSPPSRADERTSTCPFHQNLEG